MRPLWLLSMVARLPGSTGPSRCCIWRGKDCAAEVLVARRAAGLAGESQHRAADAGGGALLIYLEFNSPGTIVPGALGTLMVLLAIFGLNLLPIRYTAVCCWWLRWRCWCSRPSRRARSAGHCRIVCLAFGMLTLVAAPVPELRVSPLIAIAVSAAFGAITVFLLRLAIRARRMKSRLGVDAMVGSPAKAMERCRPRVMYWWKGRSGARWPASRLPQAPRCA